MATNLALKSDMIRAMNREVQSAGEARTCVGHLPELQLA
jgi:hypothetical protein